MKSSMDFIEFFIIKRNQFRQWTLVTFGAKIQSTWPIFTLKLQLSETMQTLQITLHDYGLQNWELCI